jgi:hypothetical protein
MPSETCGPTKFKVVYLAFSAIARSLGLESIGCRL